MCGGTLSPRTVECVEESAIAAKLYRQASNTRSGTGNAISQPIESDSAALAHDQTRIVCVRPQRSAIVPPRMLPKIFATNVRAESVRETETASAVLTPRAPSAAVKNAGNHPHVPSSSQLWKLYPQIDSMLRRSLSTEGSAARSFSPDGRVCTTFGV